MTDHPQILYIMPTRCNTVASDVSAKVKCLFQGCDLLAVMQKRLTAQSCLPFIGHVMKCRPLQPIQQEPTSCCTCQHYIAFVT